MEKHCPPRNIRTRPRNLVTQLLGVRPPVRGLKESLDIWRTFIGRDMIEIIMSYANEQITNESV